MQYNTGENTQGTLDNQVDRGSSITNSKFTSLSQKKEVKRPSFLMGLFSGTKNKNSEIGEN